MRPNRQRGQFTVEYAMAGFFMVAALLWPMPDIPPFNGRPILVTLIDVMKQLFASFSYGIGLPRLPL